MKIKARVTQDGLYGPGGDVISLFDDEERPLEIRRQFIPMVIKLLRKMKKRRYEDSPLVIYVLLDYDGGKVIDEHSRQEV